MKFIHFYLTQIKKTIILITYNIFLFCSKAIARVHRQISEENTPQLNSDTTPALTTQLQVSTAQVSTFLYLDYIFLN